MFVRTHAGAPPQNPQSTFQSEVNLIEVDAADNKDVFARGRLWIAAGDGRILRSEVVFSALGTESSVTTSFERDERLGTSVPVRMQFKRGTSKSEVRGVATYGRFRRFEVGTEEVLQK
jgi:hypothetical protein